MKPTSIITASALLLLPSPILATGERCSGSLYDDGFCICLLTSTCAAYGGRAVEGTEGNWPCPNDGPNVWGCYVEDHCPNHGTDTACVWSDHCTPDGGIALSDPVCPGGNDFICCEFPGSGGAQKA